MSDYLDELIKDFYKNDFKDKLPGVDYEDEGRPSFKELTREQYTLVEEAFWEDWELERSERDLWTTPR